MAEGFKIQDFKIDTQFTNLREALRSREKHIDMLELIKAMQEYAEIPSTWDGEIPEYAFGAIKDPRLKIGNGYLIPDGKGTEIIAELVDCIVAADRRILCVYKLPDGNQVLCYDSFSDEEYAIYKRYPDSFFGKFKKQDNIAKDALDLYDFFYETYKNTSKDKLLEFMKGSKQFEQLTDKSQEELAQIYCEGLVYSAIQNTSLPIKQQGQG